MPFGFSAGSTMNMAIRNQPSPHADSHSPRGDLASSAMSSPMTKTVRASSGWKWSEQVEPVAFDVHDRRLQSRVALHQLHEDGESAGRTRMHP